MFPGHSKLREARYAWAPLIPDDHNSDNNNRSEYVKKMDFSKTLQCFAPLRQYVVSTWGSDGN